VPRSFIKALYQNVKAGKYVRGASTIDQQVVKNYLLSSEKKLIRKFKEIVLAIKLDKVKTKDEILELYLNKISYGGQIYGIEEAAKVYFGKPAKDLTVLESAYLAGIPKSPTAFSPYLRNRPKYKGKLEKRKNLILDLMYNQGYINDKEYDDAKSSTITFLKRGDSNNMRAPHFTTYVKQQLIKKFSEEEISRGLRVYTTLN